MYIYRYRYINIFVFIYIYVSIFIYVYRYIYTYIKDIIQYSNLRSPALLPQIIAHNSAQYSAP